MENEKVEILTVNSQYDPDDFIGMIWDLAYSTEDKELDKELLKLSTSILIKDPTYGFYSVYWKSNILAGTVMTTYEFNINLGQTKIWLQSVFTKQQFRGQKVFKNLISNLYDKAKDLNSSISLYVVKNNIQAQNVYYKIGFEKLEVRIYELDFNFDKFDTNQLEVFKNDQRIKTSSLDDYNDIEKFILSNKLININRKTSSELDISNHLKNIKFVYESGNKCEVLKIYDDDGILIGLAYVFIEYSDWRNNLFWWIYEIFVLPNKLDYFIKNRELIFKKIVSLAYYLKRCGVRVILEEGRDEIIESTILLESHYFLLEKKFK